MSHIMRFLILGFVISVALIIPYGFAKIITDHTIQFLSLTGPLGYFIEALLHRGLQFFMTLVLLKLLFKDKLSNLGFNLENKMLSKKIITYVVIIWPILVVIFFVLSINYIDGFGYYLSNKHILSKGWVVAKISRDLLLLDAYSEEILYRSFVILVLKKYWTGTIKIKKINISYATLLSVPIFVLCHVSISIFPFKFIAYDPIQLILTFFTGLLFGIVFEKTKSLFAPIILHGYTNLIITIVGHIALL